MIAAQALVDTERVGHLPHAQAPQALPFAATWTVWPWRRSSPRRGHHQQVPLHALGRWAHHDRSRAACAHRPAPTPEPRVNFLLVAMVVLIWFMMNHHNFFAQPP
jgi:hypothetical protein